MDAPEFKPVKIDIPFLSKLFDDESKFGRKYSIHYIEKDEKTWKDFGIEIRCGDDVIMSKYIRYGKKEFTKLKDDENYFQRERNALFGQVVEHIMINGIVHIRETAEEFNRNRNDRN